jgi:cyclophilin family peptidyl-prolyl cis-trans isomerase
MACNRWCRLVLVAAFATLLGANGACGQEKKEGGEMKDVLAQIDDFIAKEKVDKAKAGWKTRLNKPPKLEFEKGAQYFIAMETNKGPIKIRMMPDVAPMHVSSWIYLTRAGFYDGLTFHRVIPGFMAQGGCPEGTGTGGPGYKIDGEFDPKVKHDRPFLLSTANTGRPMTDGSQFFLTFVPTPHLDGKHTICGEVVEGQETIRALEKAGSPGGPPSEKLEIKKATVEIKK